MEVFRVVKPAHCGDLSDWAVLGSEQGFSPFKANATDLDQGAMTKQARSMTIKAAPGYLVSGGDIIDIDWFTGL